MTAHEKVLEGVRYVQSKTQGEPAVGVILGSGLGELADTVEEAVTLPFASIPHFPLSTVVGHAGALVIGRLSGKNVAVMRGRVHFYEGYSMEQVTFPVRLLRELGCGVLILTNAAGGIHPDLQPGDFVRITDHINLMGENPLRGHNEEAWGPQFASMTGAYDQELGTLATTIADGIGIPLRRGVFCAVTGPSYETYAEIRMMSTIGADLVGMSTVPEAIVANHMGMRVMGISCVMNVIHENVQPVTHEEVLQVAEQNRPRFLKLMHSLLEGLPVVVRQSP